MHNFFMKEEIYEIEIGHKRVRGSWEVISEIRRQLAGTNVIYAIKRSKINEIYDADRSTPCEAAERTTVGRGSDHEGQ